MKIISPVVEGLENYEISLGGKEVGQPEYEALPALRSPEGVTVSRWQLSDEEREAIAAGADIYLWVLTFNHAFQPVELKVAHSTDPNTLPEMKRLLRLDDEFELRSLHHEIKTKQAEIGKRQLELIKADPELQKMGAEFEHSVKLLERKKAEVFSNKQSLVEAAVQ